MSTKGSGLGKGYLRSKSEIPMFIDGKKVKLLQAVIVSWAKPICFTSTGMVVYFTDMEQFNDFCDVYYYDEDWTVEDWNDELENKDYKAWVMAAKPLIAKKSTWPIRSNLDQLSCPMDSGWKRLEI